MSAIWKANAELYLNVRSNKFEQVLSTISWRCIKAECLFLESLMPKAGTTTKDQQKRNHSAYKITFNRNCLIWIYSYKLNLPIDCQWLTGQGARTIFHLTGWSHKKLLTQEGNAEVLTAPVPMKVAERDLMITN